MNPRSNMAKQKKGNAKPRPLPKPEAESKESKKPVSEPAESRPLPGSPKLESKAEPSADQIAKSGPEEPELSIPRQRRAPSERSRNVAPSSDASQGRQSSGSATNSRQGSRQSSRVNPRKVSEGLKQLPPNAYRFVRESYLLLDSDGSGSVSRDTLKDMLASLGMQDPGDKRLDTMLERAGEPVTFAGYLSVVGELLGDLPSQEEMDVMLEAFQTKDGNFDEKDLRAALLDEGLKPEEIESVVKRFSKPTRLGPVFDAKAFASTMSI